MKLTIQNTNRLGSVMRGTILDRYELMNVLETEQYYEFAFVDRKKHMFFDIKLNREAQWDKDMQWIYYFRDSTQCVTADWFSNVDNAAWALTTYLKDR